jgi:hypothetical protein
MHGGSRVLWIACAAARTPCRRPHLRTGTWLLLLRWVRLPAVRRRPSVRVLWRAPLGPSLRSGLLWPSSRAQRARRWVRRHYHSRMARCWQSGVLLRTAASSRSAGHGLRAWPVVCLPSRTPLGWLRLPVSSLSAALHGAGPLAQGSAGRLVWSLPVALQQRLQANAVQLRAPLPAELLRQVQRRRLPGFVQQPARTYTSMGGDEVLGVPSPVTLALMYPSCSHSLCPDRQGT